MTDLNIFQPVDGKMGFEELGHQNGEKHWYARDLMRVLGYEDWTAFSKAINRAIGTCTTLGISVVENFIQTETVINGTALSDYKLSRFACCLVALNGDVKKPQVAAAQAYFVSLAEVLRQHLNAQEVDRLAIREEIADREITLSGVAHAAGVRMYAFFQNAGYRGMYNMDYQTLKRRKGIDPSRSLLDFMRKDELAANLFRLTLTEGRIKRDGISGQHNLERTAEQVGMRVRHTMIEETGISPENIPIGQDIRVIKRGLKGAHKHLKKIDSPNNKALIKKAGS